MADPKELWISPEAALEPSEFEISSLSISGVKLPSPLKVTVALPVLIGT